MEMEGRGLSDLFRNTSEEIFLKAVMENSMGVAAPSMEMLGFRNISQNFREDSEELFNSWLMNAEIPGFSPMANRPRQPSRLSSEIAGLPSQQQYDAAQLRTHNDTLIPQNNPGAPSEYMNNLQQHSLRNAAEKGMQASDLLLAKAWFHSSQPMTRSRSSELRRRYAAMQSSNQTPMGTGTVGNHQLQGTHLTRQELTEASFPNNMSISETPNQTPTFTSPSDSSTSPLDAPQMVTQDAVTSVVSMLKDTLERKKHATNPFGYYSMQQIHQTTRGCYQDQVSNILGATDAFSLVTSNAQAHQDSLMLPTVERPQELSTEGIVAAPNQAWLGAMSREPSQSGSSTGIAALSAGFEVCDDPPFPGQAMSVCESTRKNNANGTTTVCRSKSKEYSERILRDNLKGDTKKASLARMGSISSEHTVDKGDPTKKRRVERSRKMAEAKERNLTPAIPSDMQAVLKRCENLEKEVRSLKLNLSFMNRKDSEQTKQLEELQKQNGDLADEKERLLEEIERILSDGSDR